MVGIDIVDQKTDICVVNYMTLAFNWWLILNLISCLVANTHHF